MWKRLIRIGGCTLLYQKYHPIYLFIMHLLALLMPCTSEQPSPKVLFKDQLFFPHSSSFSYDFNNGNSQFANFTLYEVVMNLLMRFETTTKL
jgi:hypothetical protein